VGDLLTVGHNIEGRCLNTGSPVKLIFKFKDELLPNASYYFYRKGLFWGDFLSFFRSVALMWH
jgi:hypothetical protein